MSLSWGSSVSSFVRSTEKSQKEMERGVRDIVDKTATELFDKAKINTPVRTGKLQSSWKLRKTGKGGKRKGTISNLVHYGVYVEFGTRKMPPTYMLSNAVMIARRRLQKRLEKLQRKTASSFNNGA